MARPGRPQQGRTSRHRAERPALDKRLARFTDDASAWQAVATDPSYVMVDGFNGVYRPVTEART
jgi:hypothetical protein